MKEYSTLFIEFLEVTQQMDSSNLTLILSTVCFMTVFFKMPAIINALLDKGKVPQLVVLGLFSVLITLASNASEIIKALGG